MLRHKLYMILFCLVILIVIGQLYIRFIYLYQPYNFPEGNLTRLGTDWYDYKQSIVVELDVLEDGVQTVYRTGAIGDISGSKENIVREFAHFKQLKDYNYEDHINQNNIKLRKQYTVKVLKRKNGKVLFQYSFYENDTVAISDTTCYSIPSFDHSSVAELFRIQVPENTLEIVNEDKDKTITMCGKELQVNNIVITNGGLTVYTTIVREDAVSNNGIYSGSIDGVYTQIKYTDGSITEKMDCSLDDEGNIVSTSPEIVDVNNVEAVIVGKYTFTNEE